jgi:uncharacterized peroxidase-related enzyme
MNAPNGTAHVLPLTAEQAVDVKDILDASQSFGGYVPTSLRIMAHKPTILRAFSGLIRAVMREQGEVPADLKWLTAHAVSSAAACRYCQAHTAANGAKAGLDVAKVQALMEYETSPLYSDAERAIVGIGLAAGAVPNAVTRDHFEALRGHFTEAGIVEIVSVISMFGWLNRWNDTFGSDLEASPVAFARQFLTGRGWEIGKHG